MHFKEYPEKGEAGLQPCRGAAVQANEPHLQDLTILVPFSHGNCRSVKHPRRTPPPPPPLSSNPVPDVGVHIWRECPPPREDKG